MGGCDGKPQDNTSNLSRPRVWIEMNSSALSPTLMWLCPERRGVTMGCLLLEIEGQSCLAGRVDPSLMKNRQINLLDRMTKKRARKKIFLSFFPHSDDTQNLSASDPLKTFGNVLATLSAFPCHRSDRLLNITRLCLYFRSHTKKALQCRLRGIRACACPTGAGRSFWNIQTRVGT